MLNNDKYDNVIKLYCYNIIYRLRNVFYLFCLKYFWEKFKYDINFKKNKKCKIESQNKITNKNLLIFNYYKFYKKYLKILFEIFFYLFELIIINIFYNCVMYITTNLK